MVSLEQEASRNRLIRAMPAEGFALIRSSLEAIDLPKGYVISEAESPIEWVLFPEAGLASVVSRAFNGRQIEVGVFGWDGMGSTAVVLGVDQTPHTIFMPMEGAGLRIRSSVLREAMAAHEGLRSLLLRYVQAYLIQVAQTALSNGTCTIEQRLARWLLMVHDRSEVDQLKLTHEFLSIMLGVRRTGVTLAIHLLEGAHMIRARRSLVEVIDRGKLMAVAGDGYGTAEREFERLIGPAP